MAQRRCIYATTELLSLTHCPLIDSNHLLQAFGAGLCGLVLQSLSMRRSFHYPAGIKAVGSRHTLAFSCVFVINFPVTLISQKAYERERKRETEGKESGSGGED